MMRAVHRVLLAVFLLASLAHARKPGDPLKPGRNSFSKTQDVQLGQEAAAQVRRQFQVVNSPELQGFITKIGRRLSSLPEADSASFPYSFEVVNEKSINAFALPGGPTFIHSGLIASADNEAQLAGVMAHEISHVALRHGTNQATKQNMIALPAMLAGAILGSRNSMLGQLAQLGIGLGANSLLLSYSRDAESQADALGSRLMSEAGYNPIEMARFFEKLEAQGGQRGPQFLSDHPNPGNRVKAVEAEIQAMPSRPYNFDTGQFSRMKTVVAQLPPPPARPAAGTQQGASGQQGGGSMPTPPIDTSAGFLNFAGRGYVVSVPANWQAFGARGSDSVTLAPREGIVRTQAGSSIGFGAIISTFEPSNPRAGLPAATQELAAQIQRVNPSMRPSNVGNRSLQVGGSPALITGLQSNSPYAGEVEVDMLVTVQRPDGIFYMMLVAPSSGFRNLQSVFDEMIRSVRFEN